MFAYLLFGLVASCAAVPRYPCQSNCYYNYADELFDVNQFMDEMSDTMRQVDQVLAEANKQASSQGIVNGQYQFIIPLEGFQRGDIVVDARGGSLVVHATRRQESGGQNNYLHIKTLPSYVDTRGKWSYYDGLLKIFFPLKPVMENRVNVSEQDSNGNVNNISILNSDRVDDRPRQTPYRRPVTARPVYEPSHNNQQPYDESRRNVYEPQTTASPVDQGRYDNQQQYTESPRKQDVQYNNQSRYNLRSRQ